MQNRLILNVTEIHIIEINLAFQPTIFNDSVLRMGVLPSPMARIFFRFNGASVPIVFGANQSHITIIRFGLLVRQLEDSFRAGGSHDQHIDLVRNLHDWHREGAAQTEEGNHDSHAQSRPTTHTSDRADQEQNAIKKIADVVHNGPKDRAVLLRFDRIIEKLVVERIEIFDGGFLVVKDFDDSLAGNHFLNEAIHFSEGGLLPDKVFSRAFRGEKDSPKYDRREEKHDKQEDPRETRHRGKSGNHGDQRVNQHRQNAGRHLAKSVDIVGVNRHDVPVIMRIEVRQGQGFHVRENLIADSFLGALANLAGAKLISISRQNPDQIDARHHKDGNPKSVLASGQEMNKRRTRGYEIRGESKHLINVMADDHRARENAAHDTGGRA